MKKLKLILATLLSILFAFTGVKAFADESTYTLTINGTTTDHTYEAYQIFSGDIYTTADENGNKVTTLSNITWGSDVNAFTFNTSSDAATIAESLDGASDDSDVAKTFATTAAGKLKTPTKTVTSTANSTTFTGLTAGYYLVKDKDESQNGKNAAYTRFILQVVGDATAQLKNDTPSVQKKVKDINDSTETALTGWQDSADYDIGDTVPFQLKATLPKQIDNYDHYYVEFTDNLSAGFTFDGITKVTADGTTLKESDYRLTTSKNSDGSTKISVVITDVKAVATITKDDDIVVEYNATLNSDAVIGSKGNPNTVKLTYSNNPNNTGNGESKPDDTGETPEDKVIVFTYKVVVNKVDKEKNPLVGAGFTLYKMVNGSKTKIKEIKANDSTSTFEFKGLDDGAYILSETTTPDGYNTIEDINFVVTAEHDVEADNPALTSLSGKLTTGDIVFESDLSKGSLTAEVVNEKGSKLPSTGGMGTTLLYVVGTIIILAAGALLITKKRSSVK